MENTNTLYYFTVQLDGTTKQNIGTWRFTGHGKNEANPLLIPEGVYDTSLEIHSLDFKQGHNLLTIQGDITVLLPQKKDSLTLGNQILRYWLQVENHLQENQECSFARDDGGFNVARPESSLSYSTDGGFNVAPSESSHSYVTDGSLNVVRKNKDSSASNSSKNGGLNAISKRKDVSSSNNSKNSSLNIAHKHIDTSASNNSKNGGLNAVRKQKDPSASNNPRDGGFNVKFQNARITLSNDTMDYRTMAAVGNTSSTPSPEFEAAHSSLNNDNYGNEDTDLDVDMIALRTSAQSFTPRSLIVGLGIGTLIVFSNTYFGLQTGWMSLMTMPSSLIGFAVFKSLSNHLSFPFTPVENVLIQTVAGAVGTMPLGCGFVGVIPALEFLLRDGEDGPSGDGGTGEGGPLNVGFWKLVIWSLGVCLFGAIFAVPLRKEVIIREKLRFPSGTATALMIRMLHGTSADKKPGDANRRLLAAEHEAPGQMRSASNTPTRIPVSSASTRPIVETKGDARTDWRSKIRLLIGAFAVSAFYTLFSYFVPQVRDLPIFGPSLAQNWLWTLNPSPAYVGQGIIMGPSTSMHMLFGAFLGWAILSPIAKHNNWAPGPVGDWADGSKGWIIWVSLAIMLADSIINLGWLILRTSYGSLPWLKVKVRSFQRSDLERTDRSNVEYSALHPHAEVRGGFTTIIEEDERDAPSSELVSNKTVAIFLPLTLVLNVICMHIAFGDIITPFLSTLATLLAVLLSIMGVRALGETDLNPVSGISKLTQLIFSLATPASLHTRRSAVVTNLLAGAVSEAGALQAGDMMQDLKTGHLLNASPKAQFYGQLIGSVFGAVLSTVVYKMYVNVYPVPGDQFQIPTAFVWIFTARLVTGQGLPPMAWQVSILFGAIFVATTVLRIVASTTTLFSGGNRRVPPSWISFVPGGIAVAVGMFNVPSFTLARAIGGIIAWWWARPSSPPPSDRESINTNLPPTAVGDIATTTEQNETSSFLMSEEENVQPPPPLATTTVIQETTPTSLVDSGEDTSSSTVVVLASGLILGEGVLSIVNLIFAGLGVPHL
ncbi:hypothetical protein UA08_00903 [Talaromyces atroroseus]|uniref:Oligopeptide transporter n=1 Tax=Talaromyces atroroseus TaxID=1441469 RepID=A0A225B8L3_TALAT|nr:hypothetical protein UA08_00903 [Talaromyces atroroseus]OKL63736.1 hypothetical protein UA08_00903 [Talaromyces atroroseus]